jgi:ribonuclease HI
VAEYAALLAVLTFARRRGIQRLQVHSDSQLLVRQLEGRYRVKAPHLVPLFLRVLQLKRQIPELRVTHVRREQNKDADRLANRAIDERAPVPEWLELEAEPG